MRASVPELASRLAGSSDIYAPSGRRTYASVNFVTCHDGFTLTDLVSYEHKRNEANGEENRDGSDANFSRNWGVEGETDSARIQRSRDRMKRNFLATLMLSQGVPMLLGGDEVGRTQGGNNNAYCQDNPTSWFNWDIGESGDELCLFVHHVIEVMQSNPILRRRAFFTGEPFPGGDTKDVTWVRSDGREMTEQDWSDPDLHNIGMLLPGRATDEIDTRGRSYAGDSLLILLNAGTRPARTRCPVWSSPGCGWRSSTPCSPGPGVASSATRSSSLTAHSTLLLRHPERHSR